MSITKKEHVAINRSKSFLLRIKFITAQKFKMPKIIFKKYIVRYERSAAGLSDERLSGSPSMKYIEATARIKPNIITSLSLTLRSLKKRRQKIEQLIQI